MSHPRTLLDRLGANARKSLSQNFLTSPHWAEKLAGLALEPPAIDEIWEIGPGLGALTAVLLEKSPVPVRAFEYDRKLSGYLRETYPRLLLHEGDVMTVDFAATAPAARRVSVLSNLPYHLSSPVLFKLFAGRGRFPRMVLTFQREFARRLLARPRTPDYGALSIVTQLQVTVKSAGVLPPGAFYPPPAVASEALVLEPREAPGVDLERVTAVVKAAFAHRRKKLLSNLRELFPAEAVAEALAGEGLPATVRPEELSDAEFVRLTARLPLLEQRVNPGG